MTVPQEPERREDGPVGLTPQIEYGKTKVNWVVLAVIAGIVAALAFFSVVAAVCAALLILLLLVVNNSGTGRWVEGSIGDDTRAARGPRDKGPPDY